MIAMKSSETFQKVAPIKKLTDPSLTVYFNHWFLESRQAIKKQAKSEEIFNKKGIF